MPRLARRRSLSPPEAGLALFYLASSFAYLRSQEWPAAWLLALPALAGVLIEIDGVGDRLRRRGERDAWLLVGLAALVGVGWTLYAMVSETLLALLRGVIGSGLLLMGGFFAAGRRVWRPERGLIPAGLGLLVIAGLDPLAPVLVPSGVATLGLLSWLALDRPIQRAPGAPARPPIGLAVFLVLALVLAVAVAVALPLAQPLVERAAADMLATGGEGMSGVSASTRLGDIESLALSREVALRLWSERPLRLRAHALTHFDGKGWSGAAGAPRPLPKGEVDSEGPLAAQVAALPGVSFPVGETLPSAVEWARFLVARLDRGQLVTPQGPRLVRIAGGTPLVDPAGVLTAPFWPPPRLYGIAHAVARERPPTEGEREAALQLPEGLDPRMYELAARLGSQAEDDRARVERTVAWIGRECEYSLNVGPFRTQQPVPEFLFEKKRGYCEYFASSAALLLRLQGVPARYVNGFNVRDANRRGDHYLVRGSDAHAWIEAWVDDVGWVEADPTPSAQYDALRDSLEDGALARLWETLSSFFAELQARFATDGGDALRWLAGQLGLVARGLGERAPAAVGLALVVAGALYAWRRRRRRQRPRPRAALPDPSAAVGAELGALVSRIEARWSELGHPRPVHSPPLEHLRSLPEHALPLALRSASYEVVECYYRARFGGGAPDPERLTRLRRELGKLET